MPNNLNMLADEKPWYASGLNFKCTECGKCCTGAPGYIWINESEIEEIAAFLNISIQEFSRKYLRRVGNRYSLIERSKTYDCVFLKDKKCSVYPVRPTQCRTFPFWPTLLQSQTEWEAAASYCEGIQSSAPIIPFETIKKQLAIEEASSL